MKALLVAEYRAGKLLDSTYELVSFVQQLGAESAMFLVGRESVLPKYDGQLYLADSGSYREFNPAVHKQLLLEVVAREQPDLVIFAHSSYGRDLAPRIALALGAAQVSEVVEVVDGVPVAPLCNAKLRRTVKAKSAQVVVTLQAGAFGLGAEPVGTPKVEPIDTAIVSQVSFDGYEDAAAGAVDLTKAEILVKCRAHHLQVGKSGDDSGTRHNLKDECSASYPVVNSARANNSPQVGTTGKTA